VITVATAACGSEDEPAPSHPKAKPGECKAGERKLEDGSCQAAGIQDGGCLAGELALDGGGCRPAGIPPEMCGKGFAADADGGCSPILPADPCPPGKMAAPGETACRDVAPCAPGTWGDIPVEPNTEHVDAAYSGGGSDGTSQKPWTTIQDAIDAAANGAIVAVASGSYTEDLVIKGKAVRLWGRCPAYVEIAGRPLQIAAVLIREGAGGTEVRDLAIRGGSAGLLVSGAEGVVVQRVWVHDTGNRALDAEDTVGAAELTLRDSLVEAATEDGLFVLGATATIEASVIRDTKPDLSKHGGLAVYMTDDLQAKKRCDVTIRGSLLERNSETAVFVGGSDATIEASVIRDTRPRASDKTLGRGVYVLDDPIGGQRSTARISASLIETSHDVGVLVGGSDATIEATVVRDTQPQESDQLGGRGIEVNYDAATGQPASLSLSSSIVERSHGVGVLFGGSEATIEASIIRDTQPQASDQEFGRGIVIEKDRQQGQPANVTLRGSVIERNLDLGVFVFASNATIDGSAIRDTQPQASDQRHGRGVDAEVDPDTGQRSTVSVHASVIERNLEGGLMVIASDVQADGLLVRDVAVAASDGLLGDGVSLVSEDWIPNVSEGGLASVVLSASRIESSPRAGVSSFGGSVQLGGTALDCNAIPLDGEQSDALAYAFEDQGGNACACSGAEVICKVLSSNLEPPGPLPPP